MATTIHTELTNEVQKSSSASSLVQLSRPMNSGAPTPRHLVKVSSTFHTSGTITMTSSSTKPGSR